MKIAPIRAWSALLLLACLTAARPAAASLVTYPTPSVYKISTDISVTVNGVPVDVIEHRAPSLASGNVNRYVHFSFSGSAAIVIAKIGGNITNASISPKVPNIPSQIKGATLSFTLAAPQYLIVQIDTLTKLCVLADPLETNPPQPGQPGVTTFVALPGPSGDYTDAINTAISHISQGNGGTLYFPPGVYPTGTVNLLSNVTLYLAGGAVLLGASDLTRYQSLGNVTITESGQNLTIPAVALISSEGQTNIAITGRGTLDANGFSIGPAGTRTGAIAVRITGATNVVLSGVIAREARYWGNIIANSSQIDSQHFKVLQFEGEFNNDGLDICDSSDATIMNGFVLSGDDSYTTKSMHATKILSGTSGLANPTLRVTFSNNVMFSNSAAYKAGDEMETEMGFIKFLNSTIVQTRALAIHYYHGASPAHDILFQNLVVEKVASQVSGASDIKDIQFEIESDPSGSTNPVGAVQSVSVVNVSFLDDSGAQRSVIYGCGPTESGSTYCGGQPSRVNMSVTLRNVTFGSGLVTAATPIYTNPYAAVQYQTASAIPLGTITAVVNGGSFVPPIAGGAFVTIMGQNLASQTADWDPAISSAGTLPAALKGVSVRIDNKDCYVAYVSPGQLNLVTPADTTAGLVPVEVTTPGGILTTAVEMEPAAPGWFTYSLNTSLYAVAFFANQAVMVARTGVLSSPSRPAKPGDYLELFATGLGATTPPYPNGQVLTTAYPVADLSQIGVTVGGVPAPVSYAGMTYAGVYQVNIQVPNGIADGDQPVVLSILGETTQSNALLTFQH